MIKNYTEPTNKAIWAKYKPLVRLLFVCSLLASTYSGITEFYKFFTDFSIPNPSMRFIAAFCLTLLIELSFRGFSKMLFETIFERAEPTEEELNNPNIEPATETGRPIMIAFLVIVLLAIGYVTTLNSIDGKTTYIDHNTPPPDSIPHDKMEAELIKSVAKNQFEADSLQVIADVRQRFKTKKESLLQRKDKAEKNINWLKSTDAYSWTSSKSHRKTVASTTKSLEQLPKEEQKEIELALLPYKSNYEKAKSIASDTLKAAIKDAQIATNKAFQVYQNQKSKKQSSYGFAVYLSIVLILFFNFFKYYSYKASGRKPVYIVNPIGSSTSPLSKLWEGIKVWIWNTVNGWVDNWIGSEIEVDDTGIILKKKEQPTPDEQVDNPKDTQAFQKAISKNNLNQKADAINLDTYKRPVAKVDTETVSEASKNSLSFDSQNDTLLEKDLNVETLLSKNFLDNVRNHYKAGKGIGKRGAKASTRDRNWRKYTAEKKLLETVGVTVNELDRTVKFDITTVKLIKKD